MNGREFRTSNLIKYVTSPCFLKTNLFCVSITKYMREGVRPLENGCKTIRIRIYYSSLILAKRFQK